jgi:aspartate racemase
LGIIKPASRVKYIEVMDGLIARGAKGIILGCTEIGLLISQKDVQIPLFDTAHIHATAAVEYALE